MSEQLFKLLVDAESAPREKLQKLAEYAKEILKTSYIEIRMDGIDCIQLGTLPVEDVCRMTIGPVDRPTGELAAAPINGAPPDLSLFARCAEAIHRMQAGYIDNLTGLYNRRRLDMELASLALSDRESVAVVMMDIDHFKRVNDTHGHEAGDEVLRAFASRLVEQMPEGGFVSRYGGEEFCLILHSTDESETARAVEELRSAVSLNPIPFRKNEIRITSSAGLAVGAGRRADQLLMLADHALYSAKEGGRNQTVRADDVSRRAASRLFRRRFRKIWDRPLFDLAWFGQRVIGLDRRSGRLMSVDFFGGVVPVSDALPGVISFVRAGRKTYAVSLESPGVRTIENGRESCIGGGEWRRIQQDLRQGRLYLIERSGRAVFWTDLSLADPREINRSEEGSAAPQTVTALLPLGRSLLALDPLARRIDILDRSNHAFRQSWTLPGSGYEICLTYLPELKQIMVGGALGMKLLTFDGAPSDEFDQPAISAYSHPRLGLVISTPDETVLVR